MSFVLVPSLPSMGCRLRRITSFGRSHPEVVTEVETPDIGIGDDLLG
jgi:hypothetical protein